MPARFFALIAAALLSLIVVANASAVSQRTIKKETKLRGNAFVYLNPKTGLPSFDTARQAFDKQIADLPGVRTEHGLVGSSWDGTSTLRFIARYEDKLTPAQRKLVDARLAGRTGQAKAASESPVIGSYRAMVAEATSRLAAHGVTLTHPVTIAAGKDKDPATWAATVPRWLYGTGNDCFISITPAGELALSRDGETLLVHELTHCAQAQANKTRAEWQKTPDWIDEGGAEWSGATIATEWKGALQPNARGRYNDWLIHSDRDLFSRSYDAIGWFQLLARDGVNVFPTLIAMSAVGGTTGSQPAYRLGVDQDADVASRWATTTATTPKLGDNWDLKIPGYPRTTSFLGKDINNGTSYSKTIPQRSAYALELDVKADILTVNTSGGVGTLHGNGVDNQLATTQYCVKDGGCECPDGTDLGLDPLDPADVYVAWSSPGGKETVGLSGLSLEDACKGRGKRNGIAITMETGGPVEPLLGTIKKGTCKVSKGHFTAVGKSTNGDWKITITIDNFTGYDDEYPLVYGGKDPSFRLEGPNGPFGNYAIPGTPGGGAILFRDGGKALSFGFEPTINQDHSEFLVVLGVMACGRTKK